MHASPSAPMWDIIVVGARCAGSAVGLLAARAGLRVLLIDKAHLPSDTLSTHMIHESGIARMARWDPELLARVRASGCPALTRSTTDLGHFAYEADHWPIDGNSAGYCPRRTVLDPILAQAAVDAGCHLRTDATMTAVIRDGDRVVGIRTETRGGGRHEDTARLVVGADGRSSAVARAVGAREYDTKPTTTCTYYAYWADSRIASTVISPREGRVVVAVPTNDRLAVVTAIFPISEFGAVKSAIEQHYHQALATSPIVSEQLAGAVRVGRFYGTADLPFHYRTAFGPGWALVGDAGHTKDPILARGISDAFRDAEELVRAIVEGWSGAAAPEGALAAWAADRDAATRDMYEFTFRLSLLGKTSPLMDRIYEAARTNPTLASRFHGVISGAIAYRAFFSSNDADEVIRANS
jgi:flavin-dependent dehydrogenase